MFRHVFPADDPHLALVDLNPIQDRAQIGFAEGNLAAAHLLAHGHDKAFDERTADLEFRPVTVSDPGKPLGTHVYVAMPPLTDAQGSASSLRWLVLTIPGASTDSEEPRRHRRRHNDDDEAPAAAVPAASASEALDRIEVAPEVREKISEMLWAGSSLIVSDNAISGETDDSTDFIILTR